MSKKKIFNRSWSLVDVGHAQSAARRINYRLQVLQEELGIRSKFYQDVVSQIDIHLRNNYRFKNGVVQIIKPAQIAKDSEKLEQLLNIEKATPTWESIKKVSEKGFEAYKKKDVFGGEGATLKEYINVNAGLVDALSSMYSILPEQYSTQALNIMKISGRRKTYTELNTAIRNVNKGMDKINGKYYGQRVSYHGV